MPSFSPDGFAARLSLADRDVMAAKAALEQARAAFDGARTLGSHDRLKAAQQQLDDAFRKRAHVIDERMQDHIVRLVRRAGLALTQESTS